MSTDLVGRGRVDAVDDLVERMELVAQLVQLVVHDVDAIGRDEVRRDAAC